MDVELVTHALTVARARGFEEVELSSEAGTFAAKLAPPPPGKKSKQGPAQVEIREFDEIRATLVGYYREAPAPLRVGTAVNAGDVVAVIAALGIANDVESKVSGEVTDMFVAPNQPVEYGQALARVRLR